MESFAWVSSFSNFSYEKKTPVISLFLLLRFSTRSNCAQSLQSNIFPRPNHLNYEILIHFIALTSYCVSTTVSFVCHFLFILWNFKKNIWDKVDSWIKCNWDLQEVSQALKGHHLTKKNILWGRRELTVV